MSTKNLIVLTNVSSIRWFGFISPPICLKNCRYSSKMNGRFPYIRFTMMRRILFLLILNVFSGNTVFSQEKIKIRVNDSTFFEHEVIITSNDTVNGKKIAVYASDTSVIAYQKSYYEGYQTGFYKIYFPTGKLMETSVYMKDRKNGDYTLYEIDGSIIVKGKYVNDIKDGFWAYRKYKIFGKYKNGLKHGKWKWHQADGSFYVYKFDNGKFLSVSIKSAPEFPEYLLIP